MKKLFNGDIALGIAAGFIATILVFSVVSYQTDHCRKIDTSERTSPNPKQNATPSGGEDAEREQQISEYAESHPWVCGVSGFPSMLVGFMDHHEGFFVGSFTLALFGATFFLWRSTEKLWLAGERQIEHAKLSAVSAQLATKVARDALTANNRAWIRLKIEREVELIFIESVLAGSIFLEIENIGNSPAIGVNIVIIPLIDHTIEFNHSHWAAAEGEDLRKIDNQSVEIMFPGDIFPRKDKGTFAYSFNVTMEEINKGIAYGKIFSQDGFVLRVLVCVSYKFPGETINHQTRKLISINGQKGGWISLNEIGSFSTAGPAIKKGGFSADNVFGLGDMAD